MSPWLLTLAALLLSYGYLCNAQSATSPAPQQESSSTAPKPDATTSVPEPRGTAPPARKVWTNENLRDASGNVSVVGDQRNRKYSLTPEADSASANRFRQSLEKLQKQLDDVNKQLASYKQFLDGEPVSQGARDMSQGYSRTPVIQQIAKLQTKKKELQAQIDTLLDEARKKGVEPGQLR